MSTQRKPAVPCPPDAFWYSGIQIFVPTTRPVEYWLVLAMPGL